MAFISIGFSVDVGGINRDVAQPGADGIDIYSGTQKMCGGRVVPIPHTEMVDTRFATHLWEDGYDIRTIQEFTWTQAREGDLIYTYDTTMVDVVSEARLTSCNSE